MTTILYLEDEPIIREVTCEYLHIRDYLVYPAKDGLEALELLKSIAFDIAILDIMVPHKSGLEVLEYIEEHSPKMACIILSALDEEKIQISAFNHHADDYIIKPFSPILLIKRIEAILRRVTYEHVHPSGLHLDGKRYQGYIDGVSLNLTVTEFYLLDALVNQPGRVFNREQLLNVIAPDDYIVSDRVIDAHIKNLRKKLPAPLIKTVTGIGYCFAEGAYEDEA